VGRSVNGRGLKRVKRFIFPEEISEEKASF
jgi:hypothetical protein